MNIKFLRCFSYKYFLLPNSNCILIMSKFYTSVSVIMTSLLFSIGLLHAETFSSFDQSFFTKQIEILKEVLVKNSEKNSLILPPASASMAVAECTGTTGVLGGTAFGDFDYDGIEDDGTVGLPNLKVYLFAADGSGASVIADSTVTDEVGNYVFSGLTDGTPYRVEFFLPPYLSTLKQYTEGGSNGTDNTTATQTAVVPDCNVDAGFAFSLDHYGSNPFMAATCFVNGNPNPQNPPADDADNPAFEKTVVWFNWNSTGSATAPSELANASQTGSVYGMAFNRFTQKIYTSAFIKRHTGLGPLGLGGIYEIDVTDINNPVAVPFVDLASIGVNVGSVLDNVARGLPDMLNDPSNDPSVYDQVAKVGIGAIATDETQNALYFVNLFDKQLYRLFLDSDNNPATAPTAADVTALGTPAPACTNGEWRPFAVDVHRGEVYLGGVCDGSAGGADTDLIAYVYRLDGTSFTEITSVDLDYTKGYAANENNCDFFPGWYPWQSTIPASCSGSGTETIVYPTPVLSDMKFDVDGSLVLGFMDRMGHQIGYRNYTLSGTTPIISNVSGGDMLRLYNNEGVFELESNGAAGPFMSAGAGNNQGPGGGEFYFMDIFAGPSDNIPFPPHIETTQGDLAVFPGSAQVASTSLDPYSTLFNSGGVNWMNSEDGTARPEGYVLYRSSTSDISTFSKGNGLGGLITLGVSAPAEAGGYVWQDDNSDGIQGGNEPALAGINVTLYAADGTTVATTVTNALGLYHFDVEYNTDYFIVFGQGGQFDTNDGSLNGTLFITQNDTGMWYDPDRNDSDATMTPLGVGGDQFTVFPSIAFTSGGDGFVTHDLDAGFTPDNLNPIAGIGGTIFNDADGDGIQDGTLNGEGGLQGVTVTLSDSNGDPVATVMTDADGNYYFPNLPPDTYTVSVNSTVNGTDFDFSPQDATANDGIDSDINPATGSSDPIVFDPTNGDVDIDGGLTAPTGTITGFVFQDGDADGIQDAGEGGISGVTVLLYVSGGSVPIQSVTTDVNGNYTLTGVTAGDYFIDFDATTNTQGLTGLAGSPMDTGGNDATDSDADANAGETDVFTFDPGAGADFDAGFFIPTGSISGTVFLDNDGDGIQDGGDGTLANVTISLLDDNGMVVATVTTDGGGNYVFNNVPEGDYTLVFNPDTNTDGLNDLDPTLQDQGGDDSIDSDIGANGSISISFSPDTDLDVDGGFTQATTSISGLVFNDVNEDGIQDNGEPTTDGVTVTLFDSNDNQIAQTTSGPGGAYTFTNVVSGMYYVSFDPTAAGITDFTFSPQDQGADDTADSDADAGGETDVFNVDASLQTPITNVDAGLIFAGANVTGFAWKDCGTDGMSDGVFTAGEEMLSGISVTLSGSDIGGNPVMLTETTDVNGLFSFTGLTAGTYSLNFAIPVSPSGLDYTTPNQGGSEQFDSDADQTTGSSPDFILNAGETFQDYSVGFRDTEAPVFDNPPADEDVSCTDPDFGTAPNVTASDNCDTDVEVTMTESIDTATGDCSGLVITRTYTATDDCGNSSVYTQTLNAVDNTPPVITLVNPDLVGLMDGDTIFYNCGETIPAYGADDAEATDACDPDPELTFEDFLITDGDCVDDGFLMQMYCGWIATDNCGNADTFDIYLIVVDQEPPVLIGDIPGDITILCSDPIPAAPVITATDNCTDPIEVEFSEVITGDSCDLVKITRKYTATDDCGNMTMEQYNIFIETPDLEILGVPEDITVDCADLPEVPEVTLSHDCFNPVLTFEETVIGDTCADYKIIRKWTATNDCGQTDMEQYTIDVMVSPVMITGVPADITVDCDDIPDPAMPDVNDECFGVELEFNEIILGSVCDTFTIVRTWTATDACGNSDVQTQNITVEAAELGLTGIPADVTIDCTEPLPPIADPQPTSDCYEVTIDFGETVIGDTCSNYKILRVWVANDFCGNQIMEMQTILVEVPDLELTNLPPDLTLECDDEIPAPMDPTPISLCYETNLEYQESITPGDCPQEFTIFRNWSATDDCGNVATHEQIITVIDTVGPVITIDHPDLEGVPDGGTIVYDCSELINLMDAPATAEDNCDNEVEVDFMEMTTLGDCVEDGFIVQLECCWKAADDCGNMSEYCVTVIITDTNNPELVGVPEDITVNLADGDTVPPVADVTATDSCGDAMLSFVADTTSLDCGYVITRTWVAEDECGNTVTDSQVITVNDICDCPDIVVNEVVITNATCNSDNGSIFIDTELSENIYEFILLPNYGTANEIGNEVTDLPPGSYLMIVNLPNVEDCDEKIYFDIVQEGCSDVAEVNIADGATVYCIDEDLLDYEGMITSSFLCDAGNAATVTASDLNDNCLTLTAADGFEGISPDQICVVNCFNGSSTDCDTTYLNVTVTPVISPCALTLQNVQIAPDLCGLALGSISFDVAGAEGPLTFTWSGTSSDNNIATGLTAGTYSVTVYDAGTDCETNMEFTVGEDQLPPLEEDVVTLTDVSCFFGSDGQITSATGTEYSVFNSSNILIGSTPLSGLPAGNYIVTQMTGDCTANLNVIINQPPEIVVIASVTNETCATQDGGISLEINGGAAPYTYFWSPNVSETDIATGLIAGEYSVTVMDAAGCTGEATGITVGSDCDECNLVYSVTSQSPSCAGEANGFIQIDAPVAYDYAWSHDPTLFNGLALGLQGGAYTVTISEQNGDCEEVETIILDVPPALTVMETVINVSCAGDDGSISLNITGGVAPYDYLWDNNISDDETAENLSIGNYGVTVTDANGCKLILIYAVEDGCETDDCEDFLPTDTDFAGTDDCSEPIGYCLDVDFPTVLNWEINLNGAPYTQSLSACNFDTTYVYDYSALPDAGTAGPYTLNDWQVNGEGITGAFNTPQQLVSLMNSLDFAGNWMLDTDSQSVRGGSTANTYGNISVTQDNTGATAVLEVNETVTPLGTQILVAEGANTLIFTTPAGCSDTLEVTGICLTTETVQENITVGEGGTYCPDFSELPGSNFDVQFVCTVCDNTDIGLDNEGCFTYTGTAPGQDVIEVTVCDEFDVCDVTFLVINVAEGVVNDPGMVPVVNDDFYTTEMNVPVLMKVTENDVISGEITDLGILRTPNNGYLDLNFDHTILYTPEDDFCGDNQMIYEVCNEIDCGTATVSIRVECPSPQPVNGFSPNGDGVNDLFRINGLEQFDNNGLSIYDRRGILVYEKEDYKNNWNGKWRGNDLPDGTYFYVLRYDGGKLVSGYVQISR